MSKKPRMKASARNSRRKPGERQIHVAINIRPEDWRRFKDDAAEDGQPAAARLGDLAARGGVLELSTLSMSLQRKVAFAIRHETRRLERMFSQLVRAEAKRQVDEIILPQWRYWIDEARELLKLRKGVMSKQEYNKIMRCLHTDTRLHVSDDAVNEAFAIIRRLEKKLLNENDSPTPFDDLPSNEAEWAMRAGRAAAEEQCKWTN